MLARQAQELPQVDHAGAGEMQFLNCRAPGRLYAPDPNVSLLPALCRGWHSRCHLTPSHALPGYPCGRHLD